jgi:ribosome biogenesis GTPase
MLNYIGIITKSTGMWYTIRTEEGRPIKGRLRGKHRLLNQKVSNPVAVGDYVMYSLENEGTAIITSIVERKNAIIRKSTHKTAHSHVLAANIDLAVVMATLHSPRTSTGFIDRFLAVAECADIPAIVLFNKSDLYDHEMLKYLEHLSQIYTSAGYLVKSISALKGTSNSELKSLFSGKTVLISGHSGVGKSTLLNQLVDGIHQKTAEVSQFADKGVHTTSYAEMFEGEGFKIIDTPGIKELGVLDLPNQNLDFYFPELRDKAPNCKYYNCLHINEPGCAVIDAVEDKLIAPSRYASYVSILEGYDNRI